MKNFFISILLLASFSDSIFAADEIKAAALTKETQLELAVLYGVFSVAMSAVENGFWTNEYMASGWSRDAADAAWRTVKADYLDAAGTVAMVAAWNTAGQDIADAANLAAGCAASIVAVDAVREAGEGKACKAIASWIVVIKRLPEIKIAVEKEIEELKLLTTQESSSKVIQSFNESFIDSRYNQMLEPIKTLYVISLARIFPNIVFKDRPEFKAHAINIHAHAVAVHDGIKANINLSTAIRCLVVDYIYGVDPLDAKSLEAYLLDSLHELEAELKQEAKPVRWCFVI